MSQERSPTGRRYLPLPERPTVELHTHRVLGEPVEGELLPPPEPVLAEPAAGSGPVLVLLSADFASIELRLLAAGLAHELGADVVLAVEPAPRPRAADLVDVRELVASLEAEPVQGPITERCRGCHGRGSTFAGRGPKPCRRCGGSGKVLVR